VLTRTGLPGSPEDSQARYIEAAVNGVLIASIYFPNGNPQPGPKFQFQARSVRTLNHACRRPHDRQCARRIGWRLQRRAKGAGHLSDAILRRQWVYPEKPPSLCANASARLDRRSADARPRRAPWTFWDYKRERWRANEGMRLDHLLLSPKISKRLVDGGVDRWVRGEENASHHAPAWILRDPSWPHQSSG
jgi:exodeoxyribonuclease-3